MYYKTITLYTHIYIYRNYIFIFFWSSSHLSKVSTPTLKSPPTHPFIHCSRSPWHGPAAVIRGFRPGNGNRPWASRNFVGRCYQGPWCTSHLCRKHTGAGTCTHLRTRDGCDGWVPPWTEMYLWVWQEIDEHWIKSNWYSKRSHLYVIIFLWASLFLFEASSMHPHIIHSHRVESVGSAVGQRIDGGTSLRSNLPVKRGTLHRLKFRRCHLNPKKTYKHICSKFFQ